MTHRHKITLNIITLIIAALITSDLIAAETRSDRDLRIGNRSPFKNFPDTVVVDPGQTEKKDPSPTVGNDGTGGTAGTSEAPEETSGSGGTSTGSGGTPAAPLCNAPGATKEEIRNCCVSRFGVVNTPSGFSSISEHFNGFMTPTECCSANHESAVGRSCCIATRRNDREAQNRCEP